MKLSFSVAARKSSPNTNKKVTSNLTDAAQDDSQSNPISKPFVTEVDGTKTLAQNDREKRVIPPLENEWKPHKKMKNLELPLEAVGKHNSLDFELEVPVAEPDDKVSYGLTLRDGLNLREGRVSGGVKVDDVKTGGAEWVKRKGTENMTSLEKLRYDLRTLPNYIAEFEDTPVDGYGEALLARHGCIKEKDVEVNINYPKSIGKERLGFYDKMEKMYAEACKNFKTVKMKGRDKLVLKYSERLSKECKKKEKVETHMYTIIKVVRDCDLAGQIGREIFFDLVDHDKVESFRVRKETPFNLFKEDIAKEFEIPEHLQRYWIWARRQNHSYRPNRPLTLVEEKLTVGQLRDLSNKVPNMDLKLFLEVELGPEFSPISLPIKERDDILLFFKHYDPDRREIRYVGRIFVKKLSEKPEDILGKLKEMAGYSPDEEINLYEEIKFHGGVMCEALNIHLTFKESQLEDGDIICFQKTILESSEQFAYPDVPSFLDYVLHRQVVRFRSLEKPKEDDFCLELSKLHTYDDVVERVAHHIGIDSPSKLRLTPHNCYSQKPKPNPIKYRGVANLTEMLVHYSQSSDILYYEVLDIPLPELQGLKSLKVAFHSATKDEVAMHNIRLPKENTVGDVLRQLKSQVELSHPDAELRLLEVLYHQIYKIFPLGERLDTINDQYWTLRAEEIPEEEKNIGPHVRLIHAYHFRIDSSAPKHSIQNIGDPFLLVIHEDETLAEIKKRVQKKLRVSDEEFAKWKFAAVFLSHPEYLKDSDIVSAQLKRREVYGAWEQYLGIEHIDTSTKRFASNQARPSFDESVKIYNQWRIQGWA